jgi:hypothetical protein
MSEQGSDFYVRVLPMIPRERVAGNFTPTLSHDKMRQVPASESLWTWFSLFGDALASNKAAETIRVTLERRKTHALPNALTRSPRAAEHECSFIKDKCVLS